MPKIRTFFVCAMLLGLAPLAPLPAVAAWPSDPSVNVPLCTATYDQLNNEMASDGAGGAIVVWTDGRMGHSVGYGYYDIYAQRVSAGGTTQWGEDGVALCTATADQVQPKIVPDGVGGAVVTWIDQRVPASAMYAQRVSADGTPQWTADGVALCGTMGGQCSPGIISDGAGGAIVAWMDGRAGWGVYAQRISAGGTVLWTTGGVPLCPGPSEHGYQYNPTITSDGWGGAIVAWQDGSDDDWDIYAQRIGADGAVEWGANGVALCVVSGCQELPTIVSDGAGGAIVAWQDPRGATYDVYAQRVSGEGVVQWAVNGVALCTSPGTQSSPISTSDGAGGAIIAWEDRRSGTAGVYMQRISAAGVVQWAVNGVAVCATATGAYSPSITPDGAAGAVIAWSDGRNDGGTNANNDIYAQRISGDGVPLWTPNGAAICTATGTPTGQQFNPSAISDGAGGAIVSWDDWRVGANYNCNIYAQRVLAEGQLGGNPPATVLAEAALTFALDPVRPNPTRGGTLTVHFSLPTGAPAQLELLDVAGRRIASHEVGSLGAGQHSLDLGADSHLAPGLYLVRLKQGVNTRTTRVAVLR